MQMSLDDPTENSYNLCSVEPKKLFYYISQLFLSSSRVLGCQKKRFLNLGLVGLFVCYIDNGQIDIGLSFLKSLSFGSHQMKKSHMKNLNAFLSLIVNLFVY